MNGHDHGAANWDQELSQMQDAIVHGRFAVENDLTVHARGNKVVAGRTHITSLDLAFGILHPRAQIIEGYPPERGNHRKYPRRLIHTWGRMGNPLHISVILAPNGYEIATYYDPSLSPERWEADFMTRKRPGAQSGAGGAV